ncbi:MAG: DMT family transporter [Acidimicrobiia bacterium]|nr:DMT family transporter [Acidimicrobiia bacterium]
MRRPRIAYLALAFAALLFGSTFVVIKEALADLPPLGFVGWRFLLGAAALLLFGLPRGRAMWHDGLIAGLLLFGGYATQTVGLAHTTASNSGLITGLYVVFTPLLAAAVARRAPRLLVTVGAALAFAGLALLTLEDGFVLRKGDWLTVACAVSYAGHIVYLARVAPRHRVIPLTAVQLAVVAVGGFASAAAFEGLRLPPAGVWPALLVTGVAVSAGAFFLQVWSQTVIGPSRTAIILALEPAFAAAVAAVVLGERLTAAGWVGAALILAGIYAALVGEEESLPAAEALTPAH